VNLKTTPEERADWDINALIALLEHALEALDENDRSLCPGCGAFGYRWRRHPKHSKGCWYARSRAALKTEVEP
jgi:hypothetical protein